MVRSVRGSRKAWSVVKSKQQKLKKRRAKKKQLKMGCYDARNKKLGNLGFSSYREYLQSDQWKEIRNRKLQCYPDCILCGNPASQVHHISYDYETLLGMFPYRLIQLCESCHKGIEFTDSHKNTLREANIKLFALAELTARGKRWIAWFGHQKDARNQSPDKLKRPRTT